MSESDLLAYQMPIERVLENESVKDMTDIEDERILKGIRYEIPFYTITSEIFRPGRIPMRRTMANDRRVTIERKKLVEKLKENRGRHQEIYEEALAGYQEALHTALVGMGEKAIELGSQAGSIDLDQNQLFAPVTKLSKPHHALDSYSEAIEVFEWDEAEQVELTVVEFRSYVLDKWDWQEGWLAENANYSQSARMAMAEL